MSGIEKKEEGNKKKKKIGGIKKTGWFSEKGAKVAKGEKNSLFGPPNPKRGIPD